ncbi:MAG: GNAT family N-acetyltransferase [Firmicutes bacterium]|nr:GNAT family N-acetyltransferase [Bacillota bacterium]
MLIRKIAPADKDRVLALASAFYSGDAVDHTISDGTIKRSIDYALKNTPNFTGYVFCENDKIYGFSFITRYFETEVGGICTGILDIYIKEEMRGKGWGKQFFKFVFDTYRDSRRFRLEAKESNKSAIGLYKKMGVRELDYKQFTAEF